MQKIFKLLSSLLLAVLLVNLSAAAQRVVVGEMVYGES